MIKLLVELFGLQAHLARASALYDPVAALVVLMLFILAPAHGLSTSFMLALDLAIRAQMLSVVVDFSVGELLVAHEASSES